MGSVNSIPADNRRPKSLFDCLETENDTSEIDVLKFMSYQAGLQDELDLFHESISESNETDGSYEEREAERPKKKRRKKGCIMKYDEQLGHTRPMRPDESSWFCLYVKNPSTSNRFLKKFRRRFRLPYQQYLELVGDAIEGEWFPRWTSSKDATGKPSSPLELLILGALRYLGRGWTFDDCEESTAIGEETHRVFFHEFIKIGSTVLFKKYVLSPATAEELLQHQHEMKEAGCDGNGGSMDATHVTMEKCSYRLRNNHLGPKMTLTARTYNITVNHRRRILSTTTGHPSRWNDKTLVLFDTYARAIYDGEILQDVEFVLLEKGANGEVIEVAYCGAWLLVDNGYLKWPTTIPPMKVTNDQREIRWSQWIESLRKDVECTFGILKGRWRILKTGIRLHGIEVTDEIWMTCCALHNWLLDIDGLDDKWQGGVPSDWESELGLHDMEDTARFVPPAALARLNARQLSARHYDMSGMGPGEDQDTIEEDEQDASEAGQGFYVENATIGGHIVNGVCVGGVRVVRKLPRDFFRRKLVEHHDILWRQNKLKWPRSVPK
jgi:DDE superfamily endonuclease